MDYDILRIPEEPEIFGHQEPRLFTVPPRHEEVYERCATCGKVQANRPGMGCGDWLSADVIDWARGIGYNLDPWQEWSIRQGMGVLPNGKWASFENTLIISRQNGKGTVLEVRELAGLYVLGEELIIHTAHELKTAQEHFRRIITTLENNPNLSRRLKGKPRASHGEESIELKAEPTLIFGPGGRRIRRRVACRLRFLARSRGSARGFTCNCLVYDEAMILDTTSVGASMPTMSAVANSQMWFTGSAGLEDSFQLARSRSRIVKDTKDLFGAEWSIIPHKETCPRDEIKGRPSNNFVICDAHDDRDKPASWAKANPAFGYRLSAAFTRNELATLVPLEFDRERNGVGEWPAEDAEWKVVPEDLWETLTTVYSKQNSVEAGTQWAFGIDVDEDGRNASIAAACYRPSTGQIVMMLRFAKQGTGWVLERIKALDAKYRPIAIVVPRAGPAAGLGDDIQKLWPDNPKWGTKVIRATVTDEAAAYAWFVQQCKDRKKPLVHRSIEKDPLLYRALGNAETRLVGDGGKSFCRRDSEQDITPVTSGTLAAWGLNRKLRSYDPTTSVA